jgi:hypothetical protein
LLDVRQHIGMIFQISRTYNLLRRTVTWTVLLKKGNFHQVELSQSAILHKHWQLVVNLILTLDGPSSAKLLQPLTSSRPVIYSRWDVGQVERVAWKGEDRTEGERGYDNHYKRPMIIQSPTWRALVGDTLVSGKAPRQILR